MTTPYFTVNVDGISATVDALTPIVAGVTAYFTNAARGIATPVPVRAGEWEEYKNANLAPPGCVVIAQTDFQVYGDGQWPPGTIGPRYAPGDKLDLDVTHYAEVRGIRAQMFRVVVLGLANKGAPTGDVGAAYALDQMVAAYALADLTYAALRDVHGHDLGPVRWASMGPERGEFGYGSVLVGGFGPIPIPVFGDVSTYVTPTKASASMFVEPATTGDTVLAP